MRDGTTVVGESRHAALQIFDPVGNFVRMVRRPEGMMFRDIQGDPRGGHLLTLSSARNTRRWTSQPIVRMSLAGDVAEMEIIAEGWLPESPLLDATRTMGFGSMSMPAIFEPEPLTGCCRTAPSCLATPRPTSSSLRHPMALVLSASLLGSLLRNR